MNESDGNVYRDADGQRFTLVDGQRLYYSQWTSRDSYKHLNKLTEVEPAPLTPRQQRMLRKR